MRPTGPCSLCQPREITREDAIPLSKLDKEWVFEAEGRGGRETRLCEGCTRRAVGKSYYNKLRRQSESEKVGKRPVQLELTQTASML